MMRGPELFRTKTFAELTKFALVGCATLVIYLAVFFVGFDIVHFDYRVVTSFAYVITVMTHFLLNKYFTFRAGEQRIGTGVFRYAILLLVNYGIALSAAWVTIHELRISPYFAVPITAVGTACSSYIAMKFFVFRGALPRTSALESAVTVRSATISEG